MHFGLKKGGEHKLVVLAQNITGHDPYLLPKKSVQLPILHGVPSVTLFRNTEKCATHIPL